MPASALELTVNGTRYEPKVADSTTLLSFLREHLGLIGAKEGCNRGHCGACTVLLDDRPIYACSRLLMQCHGSRITTVEGLASAGELSEAQRRFIENDALQCGFCIPGQVVAAHALLAKHSAPTIEQTKREMAGNLCRCGSYRHILDALIENEEA